MKKTNLFKMAALTAVFALGSMFADAQEIINDIPKQANTAFGTTGGSIKVIDNKGTVKYIQTKNGITTFTNLAPDGGVVTTFQLGGALIDSTFIDATGQVFGIKGLQVNNNTSTYDLLVVDQATGEFRRKSLTDLIDAGTYIRVIASADVTDGEVDDPTFPITLTGVTLESFKTVYVFRNGAKLIAGVDYAITTTTESTVTLYLTAASTQYAATPPNGSYETFPLYLGDRIEIQFIK